MKPSQSLAARLRLTTKQVNGGYYKGNRTGSMGFFRKDGTFSPQAWKKRTYVVPESLNDFKLTPFVTNSFRPEADPYKRQVVVNGRHMSGPRLMNGKEYLGLWEAYNPEEHETVESSATSIRQEMAEKDARKQENLARRDEKYKRKRKLKGGRPAPEPQLREPGRGDRAEQVLSR